MYKTLGTLIISFTVCQAAQALTIPGMKLTSYSAGCGSDSTGGKRETSWSSRVDPRQHTLNGKANKDTMVIAVPQRKGPASDLWGCFVKMDFSKSSVPKKVQRYFEG